MTDPRLPEPPPPSWVRPIFIGSLVAVACYVLPYLSVLVVPAAACALTPCLCGVAVLPMGFVPAWLAALQDPHTTPGQGFTVSFIASGIGGIVATLPFVLGAERPDREEMLRHLHEQLEESAAQGRIPADQLEQVKQMGEWVVDVAPYVPIVVAAAGTFMAGVVGMITVASMISRRARQAAPPDGAGGSDGL